MYHVTLTFWLKDILKVLVAPSVSFTGDGGAKPVMLGGPVGTGVTFHIHCCELVPLGLLAMAVRFHIPMDALVFV